MLKDGGLDVELNDSDTVLTKKELIDKIKDKEALLSLLTDKVDQEVLSSPKLKIVANYAVGYDNIDLRAAALRKIIVTHTPDVLTETVAEHTIALLLTVARRIVESDKFTRQGKYEAWGPLLFLGQDAIGKTLGILGLGRIGSAVAKRATALGMKVIYFNRSRNLDVEKEYNARYVEKETLLKEADFISIHLPLTPETRYYIGEKELSLMKTNAILVNTARGPIVEENTLVEALKNKRIFGAALDVFECEPEISCGFDSVTQLKDLDNVILTPHTASASVETRKKMAVMAAQSIIDFANNKNPEHIVRLPLQISCIL